MRRDTRNIVGAALALRRSRCKQRSYSSASTLVLVAIALLSGCAQTKDWLDSIGLGDDPEELTIRAPDADEYLETLQQLAIGDAAAQAEIYEDAESLATSTPHPSTNLRFALVLATPGHSGADPQRAQRMLQELQAPTDRLTTAENALAEIYLKDVGARLSLTSASRESEQATKRRIAAAEAENQRLREELADAEGKLEAITSIERSIREQDQ